VAAFAEEGYRHHEAARRSQASAQHGHAPNGTSWWQRAKWIDAAKARANSRWMSCAWNWPGLVSCARRASAERFLHGLGNRKVSRQASHCGLRSPRRRELRIARCRRFFSKALTWLISIDETSANTKLTKRTE